MMGTGNEHTFWVLDPDRRFHCSVVQYLVRGSVVHVGQFSFASRCQLADQGKRCAVGRSISSQTTIVGPRNPGIISELKHPERRHLFSAIEVHIRVEISRIEICHRFHPDRHHEFRRNVLLRKGERPFDEGDRKGMHSLICTEWPRARLFDPLTTGTPVDVGGDCTDSQQHQPLSGGNHHTCKGQSQWRNEHVEASSRCGCSKSQGESRRTRSLYGPAPHGNILWKH